MQADQDRCKRVTGDLDPDSGIWRARDPIKLQGLLAKNGLCIESQRVAPDRANLGPMSGPGQVSTIGAVRFARPRGSRAQLRPPSMPARLVVAVAPLGIALLPIVRRYRLWGLLCTGRPVSLKAAGVLQWTGLQLMPVMAASQPHP